MCQERMFSPGARILILTMPRPQSTVLQCWSEGGRKGVVLLWSNKSGNILIFPPSLLPHHVKPAMFSSNSFQYSPPQRNDWYDMEGILRLCHSHSFSCQEQPSPKKLQSFLKYFCSTKHLENLHVESVCSSLWNNKDLYSNVIYYCLV